MKKIRIAGVPEHFNFPWHMAIEEGAFADRGIDLEWTDVPEGTGKMCAMLNSGEADMAILLTEGAVKHIADGGPVRIAQGYVASPLLWGIHVAGSSGFSRISDLENTKVAISRYGSGSHLMAYVLAKSQGWDPSLLTFEVVNTMDGAALALKEGLADFFMWEHFTTKPLVDQGIFRRLGDCPTPWPCFVIAISDPALQQHRTVFRHILELINVYTSDFIRIPSIDRTLANRYGLHLEDIRMWLGMTRWTQEQLDVKVIDHVQSALLDLNLISKKLHPDEILTRL